MNKEIKVKWVEALRSGEYEQGKGLLSCEGEFCCLGVLSQLGVEAGALKKKVSISGVVLFGEEEATAYLPNEVMNWADMGYHTPRIPGHGELAVLNDGGMTFLEIATLIEEYL